MALADELDAGSLSTLLALIDATVPADDFPSALDAGALEFLDRIVAANSVELAGRLHAVLARVDGGDPGSFSRLGVEERANALEQWTNDPDFQWLALLVADGYYADEGNGGNRDSVSWRMLDYDPTPPGGWPNPLPTLSVPRSTDATKLRERYDVIVVGSGAGGGTTACVLAEAGLSVLLVERGDWPTTEYLWGDHLSNARADAGFQARSGPVDFGNPRVLGDTVVWPSESGWGNNAMTAGGGTRVYGAQAWRFSPEDFRMASVYGVPEGSALADWPISYDDLEPYYGRAEREIGVSGLAGHDPWAGPRSADYPMPPLPATLTAAVLSRGAARLGLSTGPVPMLVNSQQHNGRAACLQCGACIGFACPVDAKGGSANTVIARAIATGNCDLMLATRVERLATDARGSVVGVVVVPEQGGTRQTLLADEVAIGAGATETARLLLNSQTDAEPTGIGNATDQVGRHLQAHLYGGAIAVFPDVIADGLGPGVSISTCDFRHGNDRVVGGGMLANEFVPTPVGALHYLTSVGFVPRSGLEAKTAMRELFPRMQRVVGPIQEMTNSESRVRLDPTVRDALGIPVARLSGAVHPEDIRAQAFLGAKAEEWLDASGALRIHRYAARGLDGPSSGQHQAGTCRMGTDPATSVTDPFGRVWGHDNLRIVDASTHVTNGGVNPVLTIFANAFRIAEHMLASRLVRG